MKLFNLINLILVNKFNFIMTLKVPKKINYLLNSKWNSLEPMGKAQMTKSLKFLRENNEFQQFPHARDVFSEHLLGTFGILSTWNYTSDITRAGLFHTGYSGDIFIFHYFNSHSKKDRRKLRNIIGTSAEELVYLFGTIDRTSINKTLFSKPDAVLSNKNITIRSRHGPLIITPEQQASIMIITVADYLDQMVSINGWRDIHQQESIPNLYPGSGKPEIALYWISRVCRGIAPYLTHVPPIFNNCTQEIDINDEIKARDIYWKVVTHEYLDYSQKYQLLTDCVQLNPWIAEPHVLLAQLHYQQLKFKESRQESTIALEIFFCFATCWDKRIPFRQWVGFTRVLNLRAKRKINGEPSLPFNNNEKNFYTGPLVSLKDLFLEL